MMGRLRLVSVFALALGCGAETPGAEQSPLQAFPSAAAPDAPAAPESAIPEPDAVTTLEGNGNDGSEQLPSAMLSPGISNTPDTTAPGMGGPDSPDAGVAPANPEVPIPPVVTPPPVVNPPAVNLPPGVVGRFPNSGATGICRDVPLRISFAGNVTLGNTGRIRIFASNQPNTAVGTVDMAATTFTDTIAGRATNLVRPVFLDGRDAVVYFRRNLLQPNTSYFVQVEQGVFRDAGGAATAVNGDTSWSFRTGGDPAPSNNIVVQREGAGNFCTLQSALDAVPAGNTNRVTIDIRRGTYHEIGYLTGKPNVTLRGEDRAASIISYPNNDNLNPGTAARSMLTVLSSNGFVLQNLTLHNTTPQGGSQAEALRVRSEQVTLRNSNFLSLQDTVLLEGHVYVGDSYIEGNVDFVWGQGATYFENSEIKLVGRSGVIVQARNGAGARGYVFVDSRLTADPGITNSALARVDATVYPNSEVAFINCQIGPHISAAGWTVTPAGAPLGNLRFFEFQSTDLNGQPLNVAGRLAGLPRISAAEAAQLRDRQAVLGFQPAQ